MFKDMRIPHEQRLVLAFGMLIGAIVLAFLTRTYGNLLYWLAGPALATAIAAFYYAKSTDRFGRVINNDPTELILGQVFQYIWTVGFAAFAVVTAIEIWKFFFLG